MDLGKGFTGRHPLILVALGSDAANMCAVMGLRGRERERVREGWSSWAGV
jgi:hypothetical protein